MKFLSARDIVNKHINVISGHYGVGKTNLSLNLAIDLAAQGEPVLLIDMDVVNPYFRSSDYAEKLEDDKVKLIAPTFAGTTLDTPTLPPEIAAAFEHEGPVIFDVGGDDVGSTALGVHADKLAAAAEAGELNFYYVVNHNRNLTATAAEAAELAAEIEAAARTKITAVINNSHLQSETALSTVATAYRFGEDAAATLGVSLAATSLPIELGPAARITPEFAETVGEEACFYLTTRLVRTPWED
jgi:hypothetical protein